MGDYYYGGGDYSYDDYYFYYGDQNNTQAGDYFQSADGNLAVLRNEMYINVSLVAKFYSGLRPTTPTDVTVFFTMIKTLGLWTDPRLAWNNSYCECNVFNIPINNLWTPTITLLTAASSSSAAAVLPTSGVNAMVYYTGAVNLFVMKQFDSTCTLNLQSFPFDDQNCTLTFVSLDTNMSSPAINLKPGVWKSKVSQLRLYSQSGEFQLVNYTVQDRNDFFYVISSFSSLQVSLYFSRRSSYYVMTVIAPLIILTVLLAFGLIIPSDNSIKISVACTLMISLYTLQQTVARILPATEKAPMLSVGMAASLGLAGFCAFSTISTVVLKMLQPPISPGFMKFLRLFFCFFGIPSPNKVIVTQDEVLEKKTNQDATRDAMHVSTAEVSTATEKLLFEQNKMLKEIVLYNNDQIKAAKEAELKRKKDAEQARGWRILDSFLNIFLMIGYVAAAAVCLSIYQSQH